MATTNSKLAITGKPVWFITGCSTGIGRELAKHVLECGFRAVVTARNLNDITDLAANGDVLALKLKDYSNMPEKELLETVFPEQEIET